MISDVQWLGILLVSESNDPAEWPWIAWVVRNRVEAKNRFRDTYSEVILQPKQFSFFNDAPDEPGEAYAYAWEHYPGRGNVEAATACAEWVLACPSSGCPFPRTTYYYWSPVSMVPPGSLPPWRWANITRFVPLGCDPWRFIFAHE